MTFSRFIKIWIFTLCIVALGFTFELGFYAARANSRNNVQELLYISTKTASEMEKAVGIKDGEITKLNDSLQSEISSKKDMETKLAELQGKVAGLETNRNHPWQVPTNGTVGTFNGTFGGNMYGTRHLGVDIWTSTSNSGAISSHKGNDVFAACSGQVTNIDSQNGAVTIACDPISKGKYNLPYYSNVKTYYGHMGNAVTKKLYIIVKRGQRVNAGQQIGSQGDLSKFMPEMRNVHLHFSVYAGGSEGDKKAGPVDPCLYIGSECTKQGVEFKR